MTGAQSNLNLEDCIRDRRRPHRAQGCPARGGDLVLAAAATGSRLGGINSWARGSDTATSLFVDHPDYGGDFAITDATATTLTISPAAPRALSGVHYVVSRRSEGVQRPVLRVKTLELLDSAGAPNGTTIPYRDPVLCVSKAFQNESTGFLYDGPAFSGLVSAALSGPVPVEFQTLQWEVRDPTLGYGAALASSTFMFGAAGTAAALAAQINADGTLRGQGVRAVVLSMRQRPPGLTSRSITLRAATRLRPWLSPARSRLAARRHHLSHLNSTR